MQITFDVPHDRPRRSRLLLPLLLAMSGLFFLGLHGDVCPGSSGGQAEVCQPE